MFTIEMLDAAHGDCLWIEYGDPAKPKRILIDTGPAATYAKHLFPKIQAVVDAEGECVFELFVVTHIDDDHIGASLRFLDELEPSAVRIKEIWFNGYFHLSDQTDGLMGPDQGEKLSELIRRGGWPWNKKFRNRAVMVPREGPLKTYRFAGMALTVLSPTFEKMQALKKEWEKVIREEGLVPGEAYDREEPVLGGGFLGDDVELLAMVPFKEDKTPANGSSIAFLAEFEGKRVLFGADAHPSVLVDSLQRPPFKGRPQPVEAFKLPHHGSAKNLSVPMLEAFPARRYLVSTTGARFSHPNPEAIARLVVNRAGDDVTLCFNCESDHNRDWAGQDRQQSFQYRTEYGAPGEGLRVVID